MNCGTARLEKAELTKREHDVHYMLAKHQGFPFFVCIDFQRGKSHPQLEEMIDAHVSKQAAGVEWASVRFRHASVLIRHGGETGSTGSTGSWPIEIVHVLPRARGLLIGTVGNLTQGKAGNQLGALRFAEGHFVQMMDANMGCYAGETFKVPAAWLQADGKKDRRLTQTSLPNLQSLAISPFPDLVLVRTHDSSPAEVVLQGFHRSSLTEGDYDHRLKLQARIIGFREHIFTREHGLVGQIMADGLPKHSAQLTTTVNPSNSTQRADRVHAMPQDAEWTFGTLVPCLARSKCDHMLVKDFGISLAHDAHALVALVAGAASAGVLDSPPPPRWFCLHHATSKSFRQTESPFKSGAESEFACFSSFPCPVLRL